MSRPIVYDDFIGFTFNGRHCSEFGLLRTSNGDRYEDDLVLSLSDESAEVPGGTGEYYWGESIKKREFKINVAYDSVTEKEKREIRHWLHPDDKLHELIFDEKPYVKYWVKCSKQVTAKELCFNEEGKRVYKGEFDIEFTAYMPYGVERWRTVPGYLSSETGNFEIDANLPKEYGNADEWFETSGLLISAEAEYYQIDGFDNYGFTNIYNPGDVETGFIFGCHMSSSPNIRSIYGTSQGLEMENYTLASSEDFDIQKKYYIATPYFTQLYITDITNVTTSFDNLSGYIELSNNKVSFISNTTGVVYDVYTTQISIGENAGDIAGLEYNRLYYGIDSENKVISYYISDSSYLITFNSYDGEIKTIQPNDFYFNITYNDERYIKCTIQDFSSIHPDYWTEAQKWCFYGGDLEIDTNKKIIKWKHHGIWKGIAGMITEGDFFKIPQGLGSIDCDYFGGPYGFNISYPYLYI